MKNLKYKLTVFLALKIFFLNIAFFPNLISMQKPQEQLSSQDIIEGLSDRAKSLFGIFDSKTNINFSKFDLDSRSTQVQTGIWDRLLSLATNFVKNTDNQDLKCFVIDAIHEARCDKAGKQILTVYDLNQAIFGALKDLNSIIKTEGIATGKFNIKLLGHLKPLAQDLKNINTSLDSVKTSKSQKDAQSKLIIQNLLKIYQAVLDKLRNDFAPVTKDLMIEIDGATNFVFLKQNISNGIDKAKQDLWTRILLKVQRLVFASGVESFICVEQLNRCKTKDGKEIFNLFDLSANIILGINNVAKLNSKRDKTTYDELKKYLADSQAIINQTKAIIDKTKISKNKIDQDAKAVLLYLMQKFESILQKFGVIKEEVKAQAAKIKKLEYQEYSLIEEFYRNIVSGDGKILLKVFKDNDKEREKIKNLNLQIGINLKDILNFPFNNYKEISNLFPGIYVFHKEVNSLGLLDDIQGINYSISIAKPDKKLKRFNVAYEDIVEKYVILPREEIKKIDKFKHEESVRVLEKLINVFENIIKKWKDLTITKL